MKSNEIRVYAISTEDVFVPVRNVAGAPPADPTADPVFMAFIPITQDEPAPADWHTAAWETWGTADAPRYMARCLVGPGAVVVAPGRYQVFVKFTDSPEAPAKQAPNTLHVI